MAFTLRSLSTDKVIKKVDGFKARLADIKVVDGFNVRINDDELREHVAGIAGAVAAGLPIPPIEVWVDPETGVMELVGGHCRHAGYRLYAETNPGFDGWVSVTRFEGTRAQRKARIITSNSQLKLKPIEQGRVYQDLRDNEGMSRHEIAAEVGKSVAHVDQMLLLADGAPEVIQAVERGEISATEAVKLQREHGDDAPAELERRKEAAKAMGKGKVTAKSAKVGKKPSGSNAAIIDCARVLIDSLDFPTGRETVEVNKLLLADLIEAVKGGSDVPQDDGQADLLQGVV